MLQILAERNTIRRIVIVRVACYEAAATITLETIDFLLACTSLDKIEFTYNCYLRSMINGLMKKLKLFNIRMKYGHLARNDGHSTYVSIEKLIELVKFESKHLGVYNSLIFSPKDQKIDFQFIVENNHRHVWQAFKVKFLRAEPEIYLNFEDFQIK